LFATNRHLFLLQFCLAKVFLYLLGAFRQFFGLGSSLNIVFDSVVHHGDEFPLGLDRTQFTLQSGLSLEITKLLLHFLVDLGEFLFEPSYCLRHLEASVYWHKICLSLLAIDDCQVEIAHLMARFDIGVGGARLILYLSRLVLAFEYALFGGLLFKQVEAHFVQLGGGRCVSGEGNEDWFG
jgi:hypothetical protein